MTVTMYATVLQIHDTYLLVRDHETAQEVLVRTPKPNQFRTGDRVCITYNGIMTMSLPPQITASSIEKFPCCRCRNKCPNAKNRRR